MNTSSSSRRTLLKGAASIAALGALGAPTARSQDKASGKSGLKPGSVILFQGDSITDAGRRREVLEPNLDKGLGSGYAAMIAGGVMADHPELELKCYNRGVSGDFMPRMTARWKEDCLDLKPDILSILIGINDIWHTMAFGTNYKGTISDYEEGYRQLIKQTLAAKPDTRIVICGPFTTRDERFKSAVDGKTPADFAAVAKKIADDLKLTFVSFQAAFDKACKATPSNFWLWDGIHPTTAGNALMAQCWRRAVGI